MFIENLNVLSVFLVFSSFAMASRIVEKRKFKFVLIGDGSTEVGKKFIQNALIKEESYDYVPILLEARLYSIEVDGEEFDIEIWCVAGQEDYERLRPTAYPNTNCFILCYSTWDSESLDRIKSFWIPEIKHHCPIVPFIIVGTRTDKRQRFLDNDPKQIVNIVNESTGKETAENLKAKGFIECSSAENFNIEKVFETAVRAAAIQPAERAVERLRHKCLIS